MFAPDLTETRPLFATLTDRPRLLTGAVFAVAFAALACHPTLARSFGADVWNVPALEAQLRDATDEGARLRTEDDAVLNRIAMKEAIVRELLAGRATLAEATDRFLALNAARPATLEAVRITHAGATDREKTARNVISFALGRAPAAARGAISQRLEDELRQLIAAGRAS